MAEARSGLKLLLLTGQRPGEVAAMQARAYRRRLLADAGQAGQATGRAPRTARDHRVALSKPALELIELHLATRSSAQMSSLRLKKLVADLGLEHVTPHDLRRTALTWITRLRFGRDAMDRIANHRKGGVTDVYDRHGYEEEDRRIMTAVARHVSSLVEETGKTNVVVLR